MSQAPHDEKRIQNLERQVRELSTLLEVSRALNADLEPERVLTTVLEQALAVIEAERGTLWTLEICDDEDDEDGMVIVPQVSLGPGADAIQSLRLKPVEGIVGQVIESGKGNLVADAQSDPRWAGRVDASTGLVTRSLVSAPLTRHDKTIGCLQLVNKSEGRLFAPSDLELLTALGAQAALVIANSRLLEKTRAHARDLQHAWGGALDALTAALATRDTDTQAHCFRTVEMTVLLARGLGIGESEIPAIARGALLHDIGKIGISDLILHKPGPARLTPEEREIMKQHVALGHQMLRHISFFQDAMPIVLYHHEDYNGEGYLYGLKKDDIPLGARIFHAVDVYDALASERPYKAAWTHEQCIEELRSKAGTSFDPVVVDAIARLPREEVERIRTIENFSPETRDLLVRGISAHRPEMSDIIS